MLNRILRMSAARIRALERIEFFKFRRVGLSTSHEFFRVHEFVEETGVQRRLRVEVV